MQVAIGFAILQCVVPEKKRAKYCNMTVYFHTPPMEPGFLVWASLPSPTQFFLEFQFWWDPPPSGNLQYPWMFSRFTQCSLGVWFQQVYYIEWFQKISHTLSQAASSSKLPLGLPLEISKMLNPPPQIALFCHSTTSFIPHWTNRNSFTRLNIFTELGAWLTEKKRKVKRARSQVYRSTGSTTPAF